MLAAVSFRFHLIHLCSILASGYVASVAVGLSLHWFGGVPRYISTSLILAPICAAVVVVVVRIEKGQWAGKDMNALAAIGALWLPLPFGAAGSLLQIAFGFPDGMRLHDPLLLFNLGSQLAIGTAISCHFLRSLDEERAAALWPFVKRSLLYQLAAFLLCLMFVNLLE